MSLLVYLGTLYISLLCIEKLWTFIRTIETDRQRRELHEKQKSVFDQAKAATQGLVVEAKASLAETRARHMRRDSDG